MNIRLGNQDLQGPPRQYIFDGPSTQEIESQTLEEEEKNWNLKWALRIFRVQPFPS